MKLMVIDGNSIINRAFYGIRMLTTRDGTPTNAVYGFLTILQKLVGEESPDALCVCFDRKPPPSVTWPMRAIRPSGRGCPMSWPPSCPS